MAHILVADDVPEICEVLRSILEAQGYRVTCALDGAAARRVIEHDGVDLALLDVNMPMADGVALAKIAQTTGVRVILMSGHPATLETLPGCPHPHLRKPFHIADLERAVAQALEPGRRATSLTEIAPGAPIGSGATTPGA